jgi:hypothetical protein
VNVRADVSTNIKNNLVKLLIFIVPLSGLAQELCDWKSKTPPPSLQGHQGNSASDLYWFAHVSDVDKLAGKNHFIFGIRNLHPQRLLPVEWLRSDGQPQLAFSRLCPTKCGSNDFEIGNTFVEDPKAAIKYGPVKQDTKQNASLYLVDDASGKKPGTTGPRLNSCLKADLQRTNGQTERIHMEFATESAGRQFTYTVTNRGSQKARFQIPTLTEIWSKLNTSIEVVSKWNREGDTFSADANNEPATQSIKVEAAVGSKEAVVPIQILSPDGEKIAAGQIAVYLPVLEPQ